MPFLFLISLCFKQKSSILMTFPFLLFSTQLHIQRGLWECPVPALTFTSPSSLSALFFQGLDFMEIHAPMMEGGGCHWPKDFSNMRVQLRPDLKDFLWSKWAVLVQKQLHALQMAPGKQLWAICSIGVFSGLYPWPPAFKNSRTYHHKNRMSWLHFISDKSLESQNVSTGKDLSKHAPPCCWIYKRVVFPGLTMRYRQSPHGIHRAFTVQTLGFALGKWLIHRVYDI